MVLGMMLEYTVMSLSVSAVQWVVVAVGYR